MKRTKLLFIFISIIAFLIFIISCEKRDFKLVAKIETGAMANTTVTNAVANGDIIDLGSGITDFGHCWSHSDHPTINDSITSPGSVPKIGRFISNLKNLEPGKTYHVRAYIKTKEEVIYGNDKLFAAMGPIGPPISDLDGNVYNTIYVGTQLWMRENLKTTVYNNGNIIGTTSPENLDLSYVITPKFQWASEGIEHNVAAYGRLYTFYVISDSRKICPSGWHIPSDSEWNTLENYMIYNGYNYDGSAIGNKIAKSLAATSSWTASLILGTPGIDTLRNNSSGFTALSSGFRNANAFRSLGSFAEWWSSTEISSDGASSRYIGNVNNNFYSATINKLNGLSVRCVKD